MSGSHFLKPASTEALQLCYMLSAYPDVKFQGLKCLQAARDVRGVCITEDGQPGSKLLGVVTSRDTDFINDRLAPLSEVMTRYVLVLSLLCFQHPC